MIEIETDHRARCHYSRAAGWVSPTERLVEAGTRWHDHVRAREREAS